MAARKRSKPRTKPWPVHRPTSLLKSADAPLDGIAALLKRAAVRMNTASIYAGDGADHIAWQRFIHGRELTVQALVEMDRVWKEHAR